LPHCGPGSTRPASTSIAVSASNCRAITRTCCPEPPAAANDAADATGENPEAVDNVAGEPLALAPPEAGETVPPVVVTEGDAVRTGT